MGASAKANSRKCQEGIGPKCQTGTKQFLQQPWDDHPGNGADCLKGSKKGEQKTGRIDRLECAERVDDESDSRKGIDSGGHREEAE